MGSHFPNFHSTMCKTGRFGEWVAAVTWNGVMFEVRGR